MKRYALLLLLGLCTACGSYKAVRRISAIYVNSNSPMTVELRQGSTVEKLTQTHSMTKTTEYRNASTIWQLQDGFATLTRGGKTVVFTEIIE